MKNLFITFCITCSFLCVGNLDGKEYLVKQVLDGDTIKLETGEIVKYSGIDAPKLLKKKNSGAEFYAREATKYNKKLVFMRKVRLEFDVEKKDQQGRLLAYVFTKNVFVNAELIRLGYAKSAVVTPNVKYKDLFLNYQQKAKEEEKGLWQEMKQDTETSYIGNKRTHSLHRPSCNYVNKIPEKSKIVFRNRADAMKIGYIPCKYCKP